MAKLRKMLGSLDDPAILALMELIPTQSKATLARWAAEEVERLLPVWQKEYPDDLRLRRALDAVGKLLDGAPPAQVKADLAAAQTAAREAVHPAAQAAARAVAAACGVFRTPTNALGFTFYAAAAAAYDTAGLTAAPARYDRLASEELARIAGSLRAVAVPNEPNPCNADFHC